MSKIVLMGGEKDGLEIPIATRPNIYYAIPNLDDDKIRKVKGDRAKVELREKLAILAYKYDPERQTSAARWKLYRAPELDRVRQT